MKIFLSLFVFLFVTVHSYADTSETVKRAKAYYYGTKEVSKDYTQAKKYFLEAANENSVDAYKYLGIMYLFGNGVEVDYTEAKKWLKKAIAAGDKRSEHLYVTYIGDEDFKDASMNKTAQNKDNVIVKKEILRDRGSEKVKPYVNEKRDGIVRSYYQNGKLYCETPYVKGKRNGTSRCYYENGMLKYETPYVNEKRDGIVRSYYQNGKLDREIPYVKGKREGIAKYYFKDGSLMRETPYVNGKEEGIDKWYENGRLQHETPYVNGRREGMEKWYKENGSWFGIPYVNGEKNGTGKLYYESGRKGVCSKNKIDNGLNGTWKSEKGDMFITFFVYENRQCIEEMKVYDDEELVKVSVKDGKLYEIVSSTDGQGEWSASATHYYKFLSSEDFNSKLVFQYDISTFWLEVPPRTLYFYRK